MYALSIHLRPLPVGRSNSLGGWLKQAKTIWYINSTSFLKTCSLGLHTIDRHDLLLLYMFFPWTSLLRALRGILYIVLGALPPSPTYLRPLKFLIIQVVFRSCVVVLCFLFCSLLRTGRCITVLWYFLCFAFSFPLGCHFFLLLWYHINSVVVLVRCFILYVFFFCCCFSNAG